jgi:hypothetical protein
MKAAEATIEAYDSFFFLAEKIVYFYLKNAKLEKIYQILEKFKQLDFLILGVIQIICDTF